MSFWLIMHTIGSHYTFADVPFDWANRLLAPFLGEGRNHFDRVGHYIIGFYAYPMAEWLLRRKLCRPALALFFSLFFIMSVAAAYEVIEWQYAVIDGRRSRTGGARFARRYLGCTKRHTRRYAGCADFLAYLSVYPA